MKTTKKPKRTNPPRMFRPYKNWTVDRLRDLADAIEAREAASSWQIGDIHVEGFVDWPDLFWRATRKGTLVGAGMFYAANSRLVEGTQAIDPSAQRRGLYRSVVAWLGTLLPDTPLSSDAEHSPAMAAWWKKAGAIDRGGYLELPARRKR